MEIQKVADITLETLTPVFVGNGDTLSPLSYISERGTLHVVDEDRLFDQFNSKQQKQYINWIEPLLDQLASFDNQIEKAGRDYNKKRKLRRKRREVEAKLSINQFLENILKEDPVKSIADCKAYELDCSISPRQSGFKLHLKDHKNRPYLPGTEIKGAIRTSLLYSLILDSEQYAGFKEELERRRSLLRSNAPRKKKLSQLSKVAEHQEARLLRGKLKGEIKDNAKHDLLRLIQISDSKPLSTDDLKVELTQSTGTTKYTKTWIETLKSNSITKTKIALGNPETILNKLGLEHLQEWISIPKLLEACFKHSRDILEEEYTYFSDVPNLKKLITKLKDENKAEAPLLRLGQGQGFLGITLNLAVKRNDPDLYDEAIRGGVSRKRRRRTQKSAFPKTRRVITDSSGNPINLLGWCKVIRKRQAS